MYWPEFRAGAILRANLDGSGQETLIEGQNQPTGIVLDVVGGLMYWANYMGGDIRRVNLDGSGEQTLVTGLRGPAFIALAH